MTTAIENIQARLNKAEVRDVKFLFDRKAYAELSSTLLADAADVLGKYLDGHVTEIADFSLEVVPNN